MFMAGFLLASRGGRRNVGRQLPRKEVLEARRMRADVAP